MSLLRLALVFLLINANKDARGNAVDFDKVISNFTKIVNTLQTNFNIEKSRMESTISTLQAEIDANKVLGQNNAELIDEEERNINDTVDETHELFSVVNRLDKMSKLGTSCTQLAHLGNLESGFYLLDTDGVNGNQQPFDAYCKMPERQTFVGNETNYQFQKCQEVFCSEKVIEIEAPMPQLILLLERSPICKQEIIFHCFLTPVMFYTQEGPENYLQWRDRNGNYHNFTAPMGENCNRNWPIMTNDTIVLNDPALLPVTGIRYGPMKFEQQLAKISVSPLQCEPYTDISLGTRFGELNQTVIKMQSTFGEHVNDAFKTLQTETDERMEKIDEEFSQFQSNADTRLKKLENDTSYFPSPIRCPTENSYFKLIDNVCYYFETGRNLHYREAQDNCKIIFGPHGRLFEPRTKGRLTKVYNAAKSISSGSPNWYIGLDGIGRNYKFKGTYMRYASNSEPFSATIDSPTNGIYPGNHNHCAYFQYNTGNAYGGASCTSNYKSVCETEYVF